MDKDLGVGGGTQRVGTEEQQPSALPPPGRPGQQKTLSPGCAWKGAFWHQSTAEGPRGRVTSLETQVNKTVTSCPLGA